MRERGNNKTDSQLYRTNGALLVERWAGECVKVLMGIKEGSCDEHQVLYVSDESLNSICETNITLEVN